MQRSLRVLDLSERRALATHPLIRRRILVERAASKPNPVSEAGDDK
jgi:hypothetical protein